MKTLIFKYLLCFLSMTVLVAKAEEKEDAKSTRLIEKSFLVDKSGFLEVMNKYGQVAVHTWNKDSIKVKVEIVGYGKDEDDAEKLTDRVDIDFNKTGQYLIIETILDRKSGFFKELWNNINDYSKTLLSKNKIEINYEIYMPRNHNLELDNKFGDVYLHELFGECEVRVTHGNLRANKLNSTSKIDVGYGDIRIKELSDGELVLKSVEGEVLKMGKVNIRSVSSDLRIVEANDITLDSKSDRKLVFEKLNYIKGNTTFSELEIEELNKSVDMDMSYGSVSFKSIPFSFNKIDIRSKYTDVFFDFYPNSYLKVDITAREESLRLPFENVKTKKEYLDDKQKDVRVTGEIGAKTNYPGYVNINANGGDISLSLTSLKQSANK
ncbi:hypothetical protein LVD15_06205 [Fulvivirga maritima]|uniref:hypothetical protein n=1 Tax=Fulvivirga maritima TaxID=2904247 RepID=UPI001F2D7636|nr:hypothetical protein [Fulvivirga maritima]UII28014.1 hypothetical protein LVD15_06205 [Fulvivirga maritima]